MSQIHWSIVQKCLSQPKKLVHVCLDRGRFLSFPSTFTKIKGKVVHAPTELEKEDGIEWLFSFLHFANFMKHGSMSMQSNDKINNDGDDDSDELDNIILFLF